MAFQLQSDIIIHNAIIQFYMLLNVYHIKYFKELSKLKYNYDLYYNSNKKKINIDFNKLFSEQNIIIKYIKNQINNCKIVMMKEKKNLQHINIYEINNDILNINNILFDLLKKYIKNVYILL